MREIDLALGHEMVIRVMSGNEVAVLGRVKLQQSLKLKDGGIIRRLLGSGGPVPLPAWLQVGAHFADDSWLLNDCRLTLHWLYLCLPRFLI